MAFHQQEIDVSLYTENTLGRFEHLVLINIRDQINLSVILRSIELLFL